MRILQFSISYSLNMSGLDSDLAEALARAGHNVTVAALGAYENDGSGDFAHANGVRVLKVCTPQIQKVGKIKKGVAFISIPSILRRTLKKHLGGESFDLILFEAPPVTLQSAVRWAMKKFKCPSYLMQKDIFPQNAVDLGAFPKNSLPYLYFRRQEIAMLKGATMIGCMSQANVDYIRAHNHYLRGKVVELFPNTRNIQPVPTPAKDAFKAKYSIPENACVFLYGGNMGKPQQMELMMQAVSEFKNDEGVFFVFAGSGTETPKLKKFLAGGNFKNARFLEFMPREEYNALSVNCDVGMVTLDWRYTIPNYPSKTLSYMECRMPIIAATDLATDYRGLLETEAKCGLWSDSSKPGDFFRNIRTLAANPDLRDGLGKNGRRYLEENFSVERSVEILEGHFQK